MSSKLHYEFIKGRPIGHQWRVANEDDDVVTDFATEKQAKSFVRNYNKTLPKNTKWKYA